MLYISHCVAGSRQFLNRMLATLRINHASNVILPDDSFQCDLLWFIRFLLLFNGVVTFRRSPVQYHVYVDATLVDLGAVWGKCVYTACISAYLQGRYSITQYETYNIVIALWTWGHLWQNKVVLIGCDNQSAVRVCNTGKTRDPFLNACLHALWLHAARYSIELRTVHIPGKENHIADALSRGTFQNNVHEYCEVLFPDVLHLCL